MPRSNHAISWGADNNRIGRGVVMGADASAYWFAGILTVAASVIVVVVMLIASRIDNGDLS